MSFVKSSICPLCGATGFIWNGDTGHCEYCDSTIVAPKEEEKKEKSYSFHINTNPSLNFNTFLNKAHEKDYTYKKYVDEKIAEFREINKNTPLSKSDIELALKRTYGEDKTVKDIRIASLEQKGARKFRPLLKFSCISFAASIITFAAGVVTMTESTVYAAIAIFLISAIGLWIAVAHSAGIPKRFDNLEFAWQSYIDWLIEALNFKTEEEVIEFLSLEEKDRFAIFEEKGLFNICIN